MPILLLVPYKYVLCEGAGLVATVLVVAFFFLIDNFVLFSSGEGAVYHYLS